MSTTTATPATGTATETGKTTWVIDTAHSHVGFGIKHLMIATVRGSFTQVNGTVTVDENDPASASIDITIPTASVTTGDEKRDGHLRSPDFFDVERYPNMTFRGKRVEARSKETFRVVGDLTIRDVTREVELNLEFTGSAVDPWGGQRVGFEGETVVNRKDWGLNWNVALEAGGILVSEKVKLKLDIAAVKRAEQ